MTDSATLRASRYTLGARRGPHYCTREKNITALEALEPPGLRGVALCHPAQRPLAWGSLGGRLGGSQGERPRPRAQLRHPLEAVVRQRLEAVGHRALCHQREVVPPLEVDRRRTDLFRPPAP